MIEHSDFMRPARSEAEPYMIRHPRGWFEYVLPISVKGVLIHGSDVLLVGNDRGELELPGGKLELGESPELCLAREIAEETQVEVRVGDALKSWVYEILPNRHVFVVAYGVELVNKESKPLPQADPEVKTAGWVPLAKLSAHDIPSPYIDAINIWTSSR